MTARILFASSLLLLRLYTNAQSLFWMPESSYGTEVNAIISAARSNGVAIPSEYTLRCMQRLIDTLKQDGHWANIYQLYCFEHDAAEPFNRIDWKTPSNTNALATSNNATYAQTDPYIQFQRNTGIRRNTTSPYLGYYTLSYSTESKSAVTLGVVLDNAALQATSGSFFGSSIGSINASAEYAGTQLQKRANTTGFSGILNSVHTAAGSYPSITVDNTGSHTRTISISRNSNSVAVASNGSVNSSTNNYSSTYAGFYSIMTATFFDASSIPYDFPYTGLNYIKFFWIGSTSATATTLWPYFNEYSKWIP